MTGQLARFFDRIRNYPHWTRRPYIVMLLCVLVWAAYRSQERLTAVDIVITAALFLVAFLGHRGRPFWFLWGIVVGSMMFDLLARWHPSLVK